MAAVSVICSSKVTLLDKDICFTFQLCLSWFTSKYPISNIEEIWFWGEK